jgi:hypothetical protein
MKGKNLVLHIQSPATNVINVAAVNYHHHHHHHRGILASGDLWQHLGIGTGFGLKLSLGLGD